MRWPGSATDDPRSEALFARRGRHPLAEQIGRDEAPLRAVGLDLLELRELGLNAFGAFGEEIVHRYRRALFRQQPGDALAHALARPGDERHPSRKIEHQLSIPAHNGPRADASSAQAGRAGRLAQNFGVLISPGAEGCPGVPG